MPHCSLSSTYLLLPLLNDSFLLLSISILTDEDEAFTLYLLSIVPRPQPIRDLSAPFYFSCHVTIVELDPTEPKPNYL